MAKGGSMYGSVRCSWCGDYGHNRAGCHEYKKYVRENPNGYYARHEKNKAFNRKHAVRECGWCRQEGHNRRSCPTLKADFAYAKSKHLEFAPIIVNAFQEMGLGAGVLLAQEKDEKMDSNDLYMVKGFNWHHVSLHNWANYAGYYSKSIQVMNMNTGLDTTLKLEYVKGFLEYMEPAIEKYNLNLCETERKMPDAYESLSYLNNWNYGRYEILDKLSSEQVKSQIDSSWLHGTNFSCEAYFRKGKDACSRYDLPTYYRDPNF